MQVLFKPYNKTNQASAMQVLIGTPFPRAYAESNSHVGPKTYDYPPWQYVDISVSVDIFELLDFSRRIPYPQRPIHFFLGQAGPAPNTIAVELEGVVKGNSASLGNGTITGVRIHSYLVPVKLALPLVLRDIVGW